MIGYYVHHVGRGHLRNALCIAAAVEHEVTGLSSLPRPRGLAGRVDRTRPRRPAPTPSGTPTRTAGCTGRRCTTRACPPGWRASPRGSTRRAPLPWSCDVSVEVAVFGRLMGVPTVVMALPGDRADPAHRLGYSVADAMIAAWPAGCQRHGPRPAPDRIHHVGGLSRFADRPPSRSAAAGGGAGCWCSRAAAAPASTGTDVARAAAATPDWELAAARAAAPGATTRGPRCARPTSW